MKHLIRTQTSKGFGLPESRPDTLVVTHTGSGQRFTQPLTWRKTATGGLSAENTFAIPPAAKLGVYEVMLRTGGGKGKDDGGDGSDGTKAAAAAASAPAVPRRGIPPAGARRPHRAHRERNRWWP
jgi:hypothetical protein